ncbi:hypothetical protein GCM10027035_33420 [Emticicia sediminis]
MDKPTYQLKESSDGYWYEFDSISNEKVNRKAIGYYESKHDKNAVELVFGDLKTDKLDVTVVSDNKDFLIIINTVIVTVYRFLELYPEKSVSFMGKVQEIEYIEQLLLNFMTKVRVSSIFMD